MQVPVLISQERIFGDFPDSPVVKNPPSNSGDTGSIRGQGIKVLHAKGQLNPCTATRRAPCLEEDPAQPKLSKKKKKKESSVRLEESLLHIHTEFWVIYPALTD